MFAKDNGCNSCNNKSSADRVVETEVKVCTDHTCPSKQPAHKNACARPATPAARELAEEMYKNVTMGSEAYLNMLPHVENSDLKTDITAALCYYEKFTGKVKDALQKANIEPKETGMMAKMAARAGIAMNTMTDKTTSHIAEMLIEGCTMSVTTATKLHNHYADKPDCAELAGLCVDWAKFEETHIERLKAYL